MVKLLTNREYDVLSKMHKTNAEIAKELNLSVNTVTTIVQRLFEKFNVNTRAATIIKALKFGMLDLEAFD